MKEPIVEYVRRRLRATPSAEWESIGLEVGVKRSVPRKLVWERSNPGIRNVEPLYRYFLRLDYGIAELPHEWMRQQKR